MRDCKYVQCARIRDERQIGVSICKYNTTRNVAFRICLVRDK